MTDRSGTLRKPLYLVLFSESLDHEVQRVAAYFREHDPGFVAELIATVRLELAEPTVALRKLDDLHARFSEDELRDFLRRLADRLEAIPASP